MSSGEIGVGIGGEIGGEIEEKDENSGFDEDLLELDSDKFSITGGMAVICSWMDFVSRSLGDLLYLMKYEVKTMAAITTWQEIFLGSRNASERNCRLASNM